MVFLIDLLAPDPVSGQLLCEGSLQINVFATENMVRRKQVRSDHLLSGEGMLRVHAEAVGILRQQSKGETFQERAVRFRCKAQISLAFQDRIQLRLKRRRNKSNFDHGEALKALPVSLHQEIRKLFVRAGNGKGRIFRDRKLFPFDNSRLIAVKDIFCRGIEHLSRRRKRDTVIGPVKKGKTNVLFKQVDLPD